MCRSFALIPAREFSKARAKWLSAANLPVRRGESGKGLPVGGNRVAGLSPSDRGGVV
jgi:hypothetical protein